MNTNWTYVQTIKYLQYQQKGILYTKINTDWIPVQSTDLPANGVGS